MKLQWTNAAIKDLVQVRLQIAESSPDAAAEIAARLLQAVEVLVEYPDIGRGGRAQGTEELVVAGTPYIVVYRRMRAKVQLLRVLHGRQRWPTRKRKR